MLIKPPTHIYKYENIVTQVYYVDQNQGLPKHEHDFSHITICHAGSCIVRKEGKEKIIDKNTGPIKLIANEWHEIEALEDKTIFVNVFTESKY